MTSTPFVGGNLHSFKIPSQLMGNSVLSNGKWFCEISLFFQSYGMGPGINVSESNLSPKWHMVSLTGSVIWLLVTGLLRKLNCDRPCFLAIWNLTVNLLIYFPHKTFICSLWTMDFIAFRLACLGTNKLTMIFSRAFPPAKVLLFSENWIYHETTQPL